MPHVFLLFKDIANGGARPLIGVGVTMTVVVFGAMLRCIGGRKEYLILGQCPCNVTLYKKIERIDCSLYALTLLLYLILIDMIAYANCIIWLSNSLTVSRGNSV
jgi:hypothetical protein